MATAWALFGLAVAAAIVIGGALAFGAFVEVLSWFPVEGRVVITCTAAVLMVAWLAARAHRLRNAAIAAALAPEGAPDA